MSSSREPSPADECVTVQIAPLGQCFSASRNDTLLGSALRQGIGFPHECLSGGCGKCFFDLAEGEVDDVWPEAKGISQRARERGRRLACQAVPLSDCVVKLRPELRFVPPVKPVRRQARLIARRPLNHDMAEFTFEAEGDAGFLPGQFALMCIPGVRGTRAYSMSNLPNDAGIWQFVVRRLAGGKATRWLFDEANVSDSLSLDGPYGHAYFAQRTADDVICIAGGSGLSPVLSIARAAARDRSHPNRRISVFYGGRGPDDLCINTYWDDDAIVAANARLHTAISDETAPGAAEWTGHRGFIHQLVATELDDRMTVNSEFYLCGPAPMVDSLLSVLSARGVPRDRIHFDSFF